MSSIYSAATRLAVYSRYSPGALTITPVRSRGSYIAGTNGNASGILPLLSVINACSRFPSSSSSNSSNKSVKVHLEVWHADVMEFVAMKRNSSAEDSKCKELTCSLLINSLFMERVEKDEEWSLFSSDTAKGLKDLYGEEFKEVYERYEKEGKSKKKVQVRKLLTEICRGQIETGGPSMIYKDNILKNLDFKNNKNKNRIESVSNEGCNYRITSSDEIKEEGENELDLESGVVFENKISIDLSKFIFENFKNDYFLNLLLENKEEEKVDYNNFFDFEKLERETKKAVALILNFSSNNGRKNNSQSLSYFGLSEVFLKLKLDYSSESASKLSSTISEVVYHSYLEQLLSLSSDSSSSRIFEKDENIKKEGENLKNSKFKFHFENFSSNNKNLYYNDWEDLRNNFSRITYSSLNHIKNFTISLSNEKFNFYSGNEPLYSLYRSKEINGKETKIFSPYLIQDLLSLKILTPSLLSEISQNKGSLQKINLNLNEEEKIKNIYKTVWEIPQKSVLMMNSDRQKFVNGGIASNVYFESSNLGKLVSMHVFGWKNGLKVGCNKVRIQNEKSIVREKVKKVKVEEEVNDEGCLNCSA